MRVLVTRPGADGQALAKILNDIGIETIQEPLLTIRHLNINTLNIDGVQAYLSTSANGVKALIKTDPDLGMPLFAVGEATALTARQGGFKTVHSAAGDVSALARLVTDILDPTGGTLIHATTSSQAGDLQSQLEKNGFQCRTEILYETEASKSLSTKTIATIKSGSIEAVLLYSPRSAEVLVQLLRKSRLVRACKSMVAVCLSQAVAAQAELIQWEKIFVAASPTQDALLNTLKNEFDFQYPNKEQKLEHPKKSELPENSYLNQSIKSQKKGSGSHIKIIFYTLLITAILGLGASAISDLWLPKFNKTFPFLTFADGNETKLKFLAGRLKKLESQSVNNIPRLEELEAERRRLQIQLDSTLTRIGTLEQSIETAKEMITAVDNGTGPEAAQKTLNNLVERLTKLEADSSSEVSKNQKQIGRLASQLTELKNKVPLSGTSSLNIQSHNFLLAIGQLRSAIRSGGSFASEMSSLGVFGPHANEILKTHGNLKDYAGTGVPTTIQLKESFSDLTGKIVQSGRLPEGNTLLDRSIIRLSQSLNWRRTDKFDGNSLEAIVARTERTLNNNKIQKAVSELDNLPKELIPLVKPWREKARAVIAANNLLAALQAKAISMLIAKE